MQPIEITDVAARVSEQYYVSFPSNQKVSRMMNNATIEITASPDRVGFDEFWPKDCQLSDERKQFLFWQYHRSIGCDQIVYVLACVVKELCDSGVPLTHRGKKVVDVLVLNSMEYDVSDLLEAEGSFAGDASPLAMHDPVSGVVLPAIATHAVMDTMTEIGEAGCMRLGRNTPRASKVRNKIREFNPEAYSTTVPHWWLTVIVEGQNEFSMGERSMVHLDLCGAAYDANALVPGPTSGSLVPLQVFCTPEYLMIPNNDVELNHKFILQALVKDSDQCTSVTLQPKSIRHFRVYHSEGRTPLEVTPLEVFLERNSKIRKDDRPTQEKIDCIVENSRHNAMIQVPVGLNVIVCNVKSQPELNDRPGYVHMSAETIKKSSGRIPVQISGRKLAVRLKSSSIRLPFEVQPYRTLEALRQDNSCNLPPMKKPVHSFSEEMIQHALNDPAVIKVQGMLLKGQLTFSNYADPEFKRGIKMFLVPPLNEVFPPEMNTAFAQGIELSDHPKAAHAIKIINMMKTCKQSIMEERIDVAGSSSDDSLSSLLRMQLSVISNIQRDAQLRFVFEQLDELGWYSNPAK